MLFEAVEHQEMDLNIPNSEGLLPLDMAVMTNNIPMERLLLHAGAKESPHCEYLFWLAGWLADWLSVCLSVWLCLF